MVHLTLVCASAAASVNLNTSYVMVHQFCGLRINETFGHLNTSYVMVHRSSLEALIIRKNLNTSYVMVHRIEKDFTGARLTDLNTSYVMVHHCREKLIVIRINNLNTSYVMVHPIKTINLLIGD